MYPISALLIVIEQFANQQGIKEFNCTITCDCVGVCVNTVRLCIFDFRLHVSFSIHYFGLVFPSQPLAVTTIAVIQFMLVRCTICNKLFGIKF